MTNIHMNRKHVAQIQFEFTSQDIVAIRQNSIERVLNNAIQCGSALEDRTPGLKISEMMHEAGSTLWQDCEDLKPLIVMIWRTIHQGTWFIKDEEL